MIPDPTDEIKAARHRLGAELDFDLHRIIEDTRKRQRESGRPYIRLPKRDPRITYEGLDRAGTEGERVPGGEILQGDRGDWPENPATI
jgi:hypothetical protein